MLIETTHSTTQRARIGDFSVVCEDHDDVTIHTHTIGFHSIVVIPQKDLPDVIEALQAMRRPA